MTTGKRFFFLILTLLVLGLCVLRSSGVINTNIGADTSVRLEPNAIINSQSLFGTIHVDAEKLPNSEPPNISWQQAILQAARPSPPHTESVNITVFPSKPIQEPATMAEAEELLSPSVPAPGSLSAAVRAFEASPEYPKLSRPYISNVSLDEALHRVWDESQQTRKTNNIFSNPFGNTAK